MDLNGIFEKSTTTTWRNAGTVDIDDGTLIIHPSLTNNGIIEIDSLAVFQVNGAPFVNGTGGLIQGTGIIQTPISGLSNSGTIKPGASAGRLTVNGNLILDSTSIIEMELGGTNPVTPDFDIIDVSETLTLGGTLSVFLINNFLPSLNDSFEIISASTVFSAFEATILPAAPGRKFYNLDLGPPVVITFDLIDSFSDWKKIAVQPGGAV